MSENRDPIKEYDATHGSPKSEEPSTDTTSTAMPLKERPLPFKPTSGGTD
jgi:hypothetical protein